VADLALFTAAAFLFFFFYGGLVSFSRLSRAAFKLDAQAAEVWNWVGLAALFQVLVRSWQETKEAYKRRGPGSPHLPPPGERGGKAFGGAQHLLGVQPGLRLGLAWDDLAPYCRTYLPVIPSLWFSHGLSTEF
jgi:hypothetical protein